MPEHHPLIWLYYFSFAKYDLAKFGSVMKQKGLIFINFYVFGWWKPSWKVMEASSMYIGKGWDIVTWPEKLIWKNNINLPIHKITRVYFVCHGVTKSSSIYI